METTDFGISHVTQLACLSQLADLLAEILNVRVFSADEKTRYFEYGNSSTKDVSARWEITVNANTVSLSLIKGFYKKTISFGWLVAIKHVNFDRTSIEIDSPLLLQKFFYEFVELKPKSELIIRYGYPSMTVNCSADST